MDRYEEIDQPGAVLEWGMKKSANGEWVQYSDVIILLKESLQECPTHEELKKDGSCEDCNDCLQSNMVIYSLLNEGFK